MPRLRSANLYTIDKIDEERIKNLSIINLHEIPKETNHSFNILENWKRWMTIRREFHDLAKQRIGREPKNLIMNRSDKYRKKIEDRLKIQYARIPKPSKERGCPGFWKMPPQLRHPCLPPLFCVLTKEDRCEVPVIEYTGIPHCVLKERGITSSDDYEYLSDKIPADLDDENRSLKDMWEASSYKKHCEKEIQKTNIQSHTPDIENLCVFGHNYEKKQIRLTEDAISFRADSNQSQESVKEIFKGIEIGDTTITSENNETITQKYYVCIDYYIPDDGVIKHVIPIKNIGEVVLRYTWKRIIKKKKLSFIPVRNPSVVFCFKKSESVLMINQTSSVDIYFQIDKPGFYTETWELQTIPIISQNVRFVLVLWAFAEFANYTEICQSIHERIDEGAKQKIVDDVIVSLLSRVHIEKPEEYLHNEHININEQKIFNALNLVVKRPLQSTICYYEDQICESFKEMYQVYRQDNDPPKWNLDLNELERVINNITNEEMRRAANLEFRIVIDKLITTDNDKHRKKDAFAHVYYLLCATIDQITDSIFNLRKKFNINLKEKYPKQTMETMIAEATTKKYHEIEFFFDCQKPGRNLKVLEKIECPPKLNLEGNFQSPEVFYKSYFKEKYNMVVKLEHETEKPEKGKKGRKDKGKKEKGKKKEKSVKKKKKEDKSSKKGIKLERKMSEIQELDLENLLSSEDSSSSSEDLTEQTSISEEDRQLYDYNVYMITYELLGKFVEELVCAVDGFNQAFIPFRMLKKLLQQPLANWRIEHPIPQKVFDVDDENYDAKNVLSDLLSTSSESFSFLSPDDDDRKKVNLSYTDIFTQTSDEKVYPDKFQEVETQTMDADDINKDAVIETTEIVLNTSSVHSIHSIYSFNL